MPELPEVELVARSLDQLLRGRVIVRAELLRQRLSPDLTPEQFSNLLKNARINFVHRRGKHVLFDLGNELTLITHLRMSGRFMLLPADRPDPKFTHAVFYFKDDSRLVFQDQRHFGLMKIVPTAELSRTREIAKLAPEPLSESFTTDYLYHTLKLSRRTVKELLLDQARVCGLGNIYAAEALFRSKIHPAKIASRLSRQRSQNLHDSIRETLSEAIAAGSTLNVNPENIDGSYTGGNFESCWLVYGREGAPCLHCEGVILRLKQGGRSSFYCPGCQRK